MPPALPVTHLPLALLAEPCSGRGLGHRVGEDVPSCLGLALPRSHKVVGVMQLASGQWQLQQARGCGQGEGQKMTILGSVWPVCPQLHLPLQACLLD